MCCIKSCCRESSRLGFGMKWYELGKPKDWNNFDKKSCQLSCLSVSAVPIESGQRKDTR